MIFIDTIMQGDAIEQLKTIPDKSIQSCITSPPYFGLRDYGATGQIGLEETPILFVQKLVEVFREVHRVLKDDGTLWLNLGDSYAGSGKGQTRDGSQDPKRGKLDGMKLKNSSKGFDGIKPKDLIGIPWRVAFALQDEGWYLRQDIIWAKPNPMPESVTDRCTKAHEYIFMLSKSKKYYYDADSIKEPAKTHENRAHGIARDRILDYQSKQAKLDKQRGHSRRHAGFNERWDAMTKDQQGAGMRNKRDVWTVATRPYTGAHFATFPEALIEPMILASTPPSGIVLDPFMGAGTTAVVAKKLGRQYLGVELNSDYIKIAEDRIEKTSIPLF